MSEAQELKIKSKLYRFFFPSRGIRPIKLDKECKSLAFTLCPENFGRAVVLARFIEQTSQLFSHERPIRIAVVGGYNNEPELRALYSLGFSLEVSLFGIEENMHYLDLNQNPMNTFSTFGTYDLILCSQVWEHIWNHSSAFANLQQFLSSGTYLWLACPASNHPHGSPSYFAAGLTHEYLSLNVNRLGLSIIAEGHLGTPRNYRATHILPSWLSVRGHQFPPVYAFEGKSINSRLLHSLKYLFQNILFLMVSPTITDDTQYATESWVLAQNLSH